MNDFGMLAEAASFSFFAYPTLTASVLCFHSLTHRIMARSGFRILVADAFDEREMYAESLRAYGMTVTTASSVSEARSAIRRRRFDVVVQGSVFTDGSAIDLAAAFRRSRRLKGAPLIVLTGFTDESRLALIRQSGCDAILLKPCLPDRLLGEIMRLLKHRGAPNVSGPVD